MHQLVTAMLREMARVEAVATACEAVRHAQSVQFDLLLIDINLSAEESGFDVLERLRAHPDYSDVPMIACTAYALRGSRRQMLDAGFDAYLAKPFQLEELRTLVDTHLRMGTQVSPQ